ncbi:nmrA-like family domain-containing protein 1 isoform 1-T2 [Ciconia maguari]
MGDTPMDGMVVEDIGPVVLCLLKSPEEYIGKVIRLGTGKLTEAEYATVLSQEPGKTVEASKISPEQYEEHGSPGAKEMAAMFRFYALKPDRTVDLTMKLNPKARTFPHTLVRGWPCPSWEELWSACVLQGSPATWLRLFRPRGKAVQLQADRWKRSLCMLSSGRCLFSDSGCFHSCRVLAACFPRITLFPRQL